METMLVRGGLVLDGSGRDDGQVMDVLVDGGVVRAVGLDLEAPEGAEVLDATGCWVTPGFIDLHTHYDAELELDPGLTESVRHGVTTVLVGSCGLSFAVGEPEDLADMFCRVEGVPRDEVLPLLERIKDWKTPPEYLDHLGELPLGPNVCSFLGHSAIRAHVMGLGRALDDDVEPTAGELDEMARMLDEALDAGYLGLSVNTLPWDKMDGDRFRSRPTPSVFARWKEYRHLSKVLRRRDAVLEGVPDISGRWNLLLFVANAHGIGRRPLRTSVISMVDIKAAPYAYRVIGGLTTVFRRLLGADVRLQSLPQPFRLWTDGLENPVIEEIGAGTEALHLAGTARSELLRDPAYRDRFRRQWTNKLRGRAYHRDLAEARIVGCPDESLVGLTFAEVADRRGTERVETFLDLAAEHGNALRWSTTVGNTDPDAVAWIVEHPQAQIGFSDAGAHLRNMAFYNFPLHLLRLVGSRRASGRPVLGLGQAVHRVTGELADYLGIDAGRIRVGDRADLVVVDPAALDDRIDEVTEEPMPSMPGLRRLVNRGDGAVRVVLVNGRLAWDGTGSGRAEGFGTERGFGRVLRGTRGGHDTGQDGAMGYADFVNWLSATKAGGWLTRSTAAKVDPWIYRRTNGRFVMAGRPTIPQITLTTTGRRSGQKREVQLAALRDGEDFVVVASNFGQEHHPGWMYNLEAEPRASVRSGGDEFEVTARSLSPEEKELIWPRLHEIVPQFRTYLDRTDRDIRIFRLSPR